MSKKLDQVRLEPTESRRSWVQIPLGPPSLTSKLSHRSSINIILLHSDKLFLKLYIIVSRRVRKAIMPKCKSEGAEMSLRVVSGTWSPNWQAISSTMVLKAFDKTGKYNLATLSLYEFHCINCIMNCINYLECFSSIVG